MNKSSWPFELLCKTVYMLASDKSWLRALELWDGE